MAGDDKGPLGQKVDAPDVYAPEVLFPIPRQRGRSLLGLSETAELPFAGEDVWNCYELSWLNVHGVPRRAMLELHIPCTTPSLVESKSLKLYLNSLSFLRVGSPESLLKIIKTDLSRTLGCSAESVHAELRDQEVRPFDPNAWECVDEEDVGDMSAEHLSKVDEAHLRLEVPGDADGVTKRPMVSERLVSHLLRTLCPVTGQPDWGSVLIEYTGTKLDRAGILRYITSLRREVGFHENAIETIYLAISKQCTPASLTVTGRFFRRGGIDINPVRASSAELAAQAVARQERMPGQ